MSYLKDREIWLSNVPTGNPPAGYFWKFIQNGKVVVRDSSGNNQIMVATSGSQAITGSLTVTGGITGTVSSASYVEYSNVANKPALVSGSAQITGFGIFATTGSNTFQANQVITGSLFISQNLVVAGSSSIQYISSSVLDIADNIITVNAFNPGVRFGGLAVIDSGSSPQVSGSILFDSIKDQWIFVHQNQSVVTSSVVLMGPETYNDLGNESYISANRLPKGSGVEHLRDSNISDTGTVVSVNSNTQVTGSFTVVSGSAVELQVTNLGVNIGSALTDSHIISGSVRINPNGLFVSGSGNVGIGTNNPSTLLHVSGSSASIGRIVSTFALSSGFSDVVQILNPNQTGGGLSFNIGKAESTRNLGKIVYAHSSDGSTSNRLAFGFFDADNLLNLTAGGNVGIGTALPGNLLALEKSSNSGSGSTFPRIKVINTLATQGDGTSTFNFADIMISAGNEAVNMFLATTFAAGTWAPAGIINVSTNHDLQLKTNNTTRLTIANSGAATFSSSVTAGAFLTSGASGTAGQEAIRINNDNGYIGFFNTANSTRSGYIQGNTTDLTIATSPSTPLIFATANAEKMRITSAGNVGIGTSSPSTRLDIANGTLTLPTLRGRTYQLDNVSSANPNFVNGTGFNSIPVRVGDIIDLPFSQTRTVTAVTDTQLTVNAAWSVSFAGSNVEGRGGIVFEANNAERMRVTSGGTLYINATSNPLPDNATPQLGVVGGAGTDAVSIKHLADGNNTFNIWQTGTTAHNAIVFYKGNTQSSRGNINVTTSGTTYNSVSDYRLKENVVPVENGIDRLMQLKPSKFNWIETGNEAEGFIAHELQEIFPDAVTGEKDETYESTGNIKPQSVDYGRITPLLVKALQEQQTLIESLKSRIEILEQ